MEATITQQLELLSSKELKDINGGDNGWVFVLGSLLGGPFVGLGMYVGYNDAAKE